MTIKAPAPAGALSRNRPATPFTPEEIEALTALAYMTGQDMHAETSGGVVLVGMAGIADQLVMECAALRARAEAAEARVAELEGVLTETAGALKHALENLQDQHAFRDEWMALGSVEAMLGTQWEGGVPWYVQLGSVLHSVSSPKEAPSDQS